jgi:hypothetical protein
MKVKNSPSYSFPELYKQNAKIQINNQSVHVQEKSRLSDFSLSVETVSWTHQAFDSMLL